MLTKKLFLTGSFVMLVKKLALKTYTPDADKS